MNYHDIYMDLMSRAKERPSDFLGHLHHIVPKSIAPELEHEPFNLVQLTNREHLVAHTLLTRFISKSEKLYTKIANALLGMVYHPQTSRHAKPWLVKYARALHSKYHHQLGKPLSEATKQKISQANKGKIDSEANRLQKAISKIESSLTNAKGWQKTPANTYRVTASHNGKQTGLGTFNTPEKARSVFVKNRRQYLKELKQRLKELS